MKAGRQSSRLALSQSEVTVAIGVSAASVSKGKVNALEAALLNKN